MKHYEIKLSFETYRDLTADELSNLEGHLTLQIEEPANADQEDEDYETIETPPRIEIKQQIP